MRYSRRCGPPSRWSTTSSSLYPAVYNIVIAALFAHLLWFRLLALYPAGIASISTLLIPVVGLLSSALILGESVGWTELLALIMVVAALAVVFRPWRARSER